jgi:amino acid adenylation domain-containing protein
LLLNCHLALKSNYRSKGEEITGSTVGFTKTSVTKRSAIKSTLKMSDSLKHGFKIPAEQQAIRDKRFHPSGTFVEFPIEDVETSIPARFEKIVSRYPDQMAIQCDDQAITYKKLNQAADRLAHYLRQHGVQAGMPVGICVTRSVEMAIGILAILKAGGAYLPLDPAYPQERLSLMLEDSRALLIVTQDRLVQKLPSHGYRVVYVDATDTLNNPLEYTSKSQVNAGHLAYVMYTSGSTGTPKGVKISHANVLKYLQAINSKLCINPNDVYLHTASFSFSSSVRQLFLPLLHGAKILIATHEQTRSPRLLLELIRNRGVTVCDTIPSFWRHLIQSIELLEPELRTALHESKLRLLLFSGEILSWDIPKALVGKFGDQTRMVNIYGQTETIGTSVYSIPTEPNSRNGTVPVGRPFAGTQIHILDSQRQPLPIGVEGELYVEGPCVGCGYLNRSELTAESFMTNYLSDRTTTTIYKTGDLARYLPDGSIEVIGRIDDQMKIRGIRVEMGEIEWTLGQHPAVREVVVIAREDHNGEKQLVAYVVSDRDSSLSAGKLHWFMKEKLPEHLIPSRFVFLPKLPRTPNNKLDRRALPLPDSKRPDLADPFIHPRNKVERKLAKIWVKVLGIRQIGVHDDFFELGGHSLLAVRLVCEMERRFGKRIPVATLLTSPTIAELAHVIPELNKAVPSLLIVIQPEGSKPPFFCAHGTDSYVQLARYLGPDQPFYGLAQHLEGRKVRHTRIEDIAAHYLREIRTVQPEGPYYIGGHSLGGLIAFEMTQQLQQQDQEIALLVLLDTRPPRIHPSGTSGTSAKSAAEQNFNCFSMRSLKRELYFLRQRVKETLQKDTKTVVCDVYHRLGIPLSPRLQTFYVDQVVYGRIYPKAQSSYVPQAYSGRAVYLKSAETQGRVAGWKELMTEGLEILPVPGDHLSMLVEPNVRRVAETLKECLLKAQASVHSTKQSQTRSSEDRREERPTSVGRESKATSL